MVGMGVVETDNTFPAAPRQFERGDHLFRMDAVAVLEGVAARVLAGHGHGDDTVAVVQMAKDDAAAFVGIAALRLPADQVIICLADCQHGHSPAVFDAPARMALGTRSQSSNASRWRL